MRHLLLILLILALVAPTGLAATEQAFVGTLEVTPDRGPVGSRVTLTGSGLPPNVSLDVVWTTVEADWVLEHENDEYIGIFTGRSFEEARRPIATVSTDGSGRITSALKIPEDYGGVHDIYLTHNGRVLTKAGFRTLPEATVAPASGPLGTPIRVKITGLDPVQPLETWYWLLYDNKLAGYITGAPYRAKSQSPLKYVPIFKFTFTLTAGEAILPPRIEAQWTRPVAGTEPQPASPVLWSDPQSAPVGASAVLRGKGFTPGNQVELLFYNMKGSRVTTSGFVSYFEPLGTVTVGTDGRFEWAYKIPDHLGGFHRIVARVRGLDVASTVMTTTRTALPLSTREVRVGDEIVVHVKGIGWTETDNIFAILYDNSYIGYACGFNSDGDVIVKISATGSPGWHYIDLYPTFYRNKDYNKSMELPFLFRHAMLSWQDHPQSFVFRYAFKIVK